MPLRGVSALVIEEDAHHGEARPDHVDPPRRSRHASHELRRERALAEGARPCPLK